MNAGLKKKPNSIIELSPSIGGRSSVSLLSFLLYQATQNRRGKPIAL